MRLLVRNWREVPLDLNEIHALLGKQTLARSRDTFSRSFRPRFIEGSPRNSWVICRAIEDSGADPKDLRHFYYFFTARSEFLLYKYVSEELFAQFQVGDWTIRSAEVADWIQRVNGERGAEWTPTIQSKVARGLLAALRDFHLLEGRLVKKILPPSLSPESASFLAWILSNYFQESGRTLKNHSDWRLFLLSETAVERLFLEAHQLGYLHYQSAGSTVRIEFPTDDLSRYAKQLFR